MLVNRTPPNSSPALHSHKSHGCRPLCARALAPRSDHRRGRLHRLAPRRRAARPRRRLVLLDDFSTGRRSNIEHLLGQPGSSSSRARRSTPSSSTTRRVDRRDAAPRLGGRRAADRRRRRSARCSATSAAPTSSSRPPSGTASGCCSRRPRRSTARTRPGRSPRTPTGSSARRSSRAGPTRSRRASARRWRTATTATARPRSIVARLFNTVGPRQTAAYGMVLPRFVRQALDGEDLTVYGNGTQTRCFTHVADTVAGAAAAARQRRRGRAASSTSASQTEIPVIELARRVIERDRLELEDPARPLRGRLRRGLRGARPAQAGHARDPRARPAGRRRARSTTRSTT